jgi:hypothetical protein
MNVGEIRGSHGDKYEDGWWILTNVLEELPVSIIRVIPCCHHQCYNLMMEAVSSSKMSVNIYQTTQSYIPQDSHLQHECCVAPKTTKYKTRITEVGTMCSSRHVIKATSHYSGATRMANTASYC